MNHNVDGHDFREYNRTFHDLVINCNELNTILCLLAEGYRSKYIIKIEVLLLQITVYFLIQRTM